MTGSYKKIASCKFTYIRLGEQYPSTRQFHALASNEKSIGRCDIIRRCTMGNKLRNYHTKRLPVPGTMAQPNRGTDWTVEARSPETERRPVGYIICIRRKAHYDSNPVLRYFRADALTNVSQPSEKDSCCTLYVRPRSAPRNCADVYESSLSLVIWENWVENLL